MFLIQKVIGVLLLPSVLVALALVVGLISLWTVRCRQAGRLLVSAAVVAYLFLGWGVPFGQVNNRLERRYPPLLDPRSVVRVPWVVVLGGGHRVAAWLPVTSRPAESALYRVAEGVRLQRQIPGSRLLFTGFDGGSGVSVAAVGRDLALALGVAPEAILIEERPRTTAEEAAMVRDIVGAAPFILVTSAVHMPRAMFLFHAKGLKPVPAPTQHHVSGPGGSLWKLLTPRPEHVVEADVVSHELLGIVWAKLTR